MASRVKDDSNNGKTWDFTKRKKWQELIIRELAGAIMFVLSDTGKVIFCGESAREMLGWHDGIENCRITDVMHPEDEPAFAEAFNRSLQSVSKLNIFVRFKSLLPQPPGAVKLRPIDKWPVFEIHGHPHFVEKDSTSTDSSHLDESGMPLDLRTLPGPSTGIPAGRPVAGKLNLECACFFATARPYPSKNMALFDEFLELQLDSVRLRTELEQAKKYAAQRAAAEKGQSAYPLSPVAQSIAPPNLADFPTTFLHHSASAQQLNINRDAPQPTSRASFNDIASSVAGPSGTAKSTAGQGRRNTIASGHAAGHGRAEKGKEKERDEEDGDVTEPPTKKRRRRQPAMDQYVCVTCGRTDSPEWRKGPMGPKTLCNACGLKHSKKAKKKDDGDDSPVIGTGSASGSMLNPSGLSNELTSSSSAPAFGGFASSSGPSQMFPPPPPPTSTFLHSTTHSVLKEITGPYIGFDRKGKGKAKEDSFSSSSYHGSYGGYGGGHDGGEDVSGSYGYDVVMGDGIRANDGSSFGVAMSTSVKGDTSVGPLHHLTAYTSAATPAISKLSLPTMGTHSSTNSISGMGHSNSRPRYPVSMPMSIDEVSTLAPPVSSGLGFDPISHPHTRERSTSTTSTSFDLRPMQSYFTASANHLPSPSNSHQRHHEAVPHLPPIQTGFSYSGHGTGSSASAHSGSGNGTGQSGQGIPGSASYGRGYAGSSVYGVGGEAARGLGSGSAGGSGSVSRSGSG